MVRIFIVDDHPLIRDGMALLIGAEPDLQICGSVGSLAEAMQQIPDAHPDLILADLSLKDGSGLDLISKIRVQYPAIKSLVVSAHDENVYAERALRSGASGYVNKQECDTTLLTAIRAVLDGRRFVSQEILQRLLTQVIERTEAVDTDPIEWLTDRELQVFRLIGQGKTPAAIAKTLHLSPHTIDSHREKIRHKLNLSNGRELMQAAMRWVLDQEK